MTNSLDVERLWKRVGLQELRQNLKRAETLIDAFEQALKSLPSCDECAKGALLEQIRVTSKEVGIEAVSLSVLAEAMREAVTVAEETQSELHANAPDPCRCAGERCRCHG